MKPLLGSILLAMSMTASAQNTWILTPRTGNFKALVDPSGKHHTIVYPGQRLRHQDGPGFTQYPNPIGGFLQIYRNGAESRHWLDSNR